MRYGLLLWLMLNVFSAQAEVLDDPMRPPGYVQAGIGTKVSVKKGWHLSAIRIDAENRIAIINGRTVAVGEWVNKARLIEVLPQKVKLKGSQGLFSVRLVKAQVKKNSASQSKTNRN
ncbi:hypothetical protein MNBD_GAMMA25-1128 [hydrothermal vent metagenome]|uniref:MSHA biogenesis protein MshK n=1 Tax=hydrothermal vent metagenome TaxID=652676 RepID=A0A3B1B7J7_9ZZZZ